MPNGQPKFLIRDELRVAAMRQLNVSKSSFGFAWIDAIETRGSYQSWRPLFGARPSAEASRFPIPRTRYRRAVCGNVLWVSAVPSNVAFWGQSGVRRETGKE